MFDFDVVTGPTHGKPQPSTEATHPAPAPSTPAEPPRPDEEVHRERRAA